MSSNKQRSIGSDRSSSSRSNHRSNINSRSRSNLRHRCHSYRGHPPFYVSEKTMSESAEQGTQEIDWSSRLSG